MIRTKYIRNRFTTIKLCVDLVNKVRRKHPDVSLSQLLRDGFFWLISSNIKEIPKIELDGAQKDYTIYIVPSLRYEIRRRFPNITYSELFNYILYVISKEGPKNGPTEKTEEPERGDQ